MSDTTNPSSDPSSDPSTDPNQPQNTPVAKSAFNWGSLVVSAASALSGILATPYGIYIAAGLALVVGIFGIFVHGWIKDYIFKKQEADAGGKTGGDAADGQKKENDNRDNVDDFFGRKDRS